MQRIFLLRAYGDFVIALQAIAKSDKKIQLVASDHLAPLYHALLAAAAIPPLAIEFIALGIHHGQLNFFTNKHLFSWETLQQLGKLKAYIKANPNHSGADFIEQDLRVPFFNFLVGHSFKAVVAPGAQVYPAYAAWLGLEREELKEVSFQDQRITKLIVIPDARLQKRVLQPALLEKLKTYTLDNGVEFKIASMHHQLASTDLIYDNFDGLIQYLLAADFIICTDSLPAHLAYLLKKPHYIFYPKKGMTHFFTPYALANNAVGNFEQTDFTFLNHSIAS
jgi:hypothetical protein